MVIRHSKHSEVIVNPIRGNALSTTKECSVRRLDVCNHPNSLMNLEQRVHKLESPLKEQTPNGTFGDLFSFITVMKNSLLLDKMLAFTP